MINNNLYSGCIHHISGFQSGPALTLWSITLWFSYTIATFHLYIAFMFQGAYVGQLVGLGFIIWIWIGSIFYRPNTYPPPISVKQCVVFNSSRNGVMAENGIIYNNFKEYR